MRSWPAPDVPTLPGSGRGLRLFDTAAGEIRPTTPGPTATIYVCGITPYDATHLGHAATYLAFDLVQRMWLDAGHRVHYVQNVTDVDDPLLERATATGVSWSELAEREIQLFREDMSALRVLPPQQYLGVVESVDEIAVTVEKLLASGLAYRLDEDIYASTAASKDFGHVSRYDRATMLALFAERGGDPDRAGKQDPLDALLWRGKRAGEPSWDSPVGPGRPGWHVECSVIASSMLGPGFDVQGGGVDLRFPHHEYSAAHAEVLSGERFAQHYVHAGMIALDGEKMSKSRGNLVFVSKLRGAGVDPMAIRLALLDGHYRADREWTGGRLPAAERRLTQWRQAVRGGSRTGASAADRAGGADDLATIETIRDRLADDLDTVGAIAAIDRWASRAAGSGNASADGGSAGDGAIGGDPAGGTGQVVAQAIDALLGIRL